MPNGVQRDSDTAHDGVTHVIEESVPTLEPAKSELPQLKGVAYISMTGDLPTPEIRMAMNGTLSNDHPESLPRFGPFITKDTRIMPITTSPRCERLVMEYLDNGWAVFVENEKDAILPVHRLPGIYLFRIRNGMREVHRVQETGKIQKVYP